MKQISFLGLALAGLLVLAGVPNRSPAQSAGTPVYSADDQADNERLMAAAEKLRKAGQLVREAVLTNQFNHASCPVKLDPPKTQPLTGRALCAAARAAHIRVGWYYHCASTNEWDLDLAGGYALTKDGVVGTCFHVVQPPDDSRKSYLVAADETGRVYPVTEILAASAHADVAILRVAAKDFKPLPLSTDVQPGDRCACFSEPDGMRGYYTEGVVSRFVTTTDTPPVLMVDVSLDWAPGSSGSAVLDACGNLIGHVDTIQSINSDPDDASDNVPPEGKGEKGADKTQENEIANVPPGGDASTSTYMNVHEAVAAKEVLSLIHQPAK